MKRLAILLFAIISALSAYCQSNLQDGDRCFDKGDYVCAVTNYNNIFKNAAGKDKQIAEIKLTRAKWCADHLKIANQSFKNKDYKASKENYQNVLDSNPNDLYVKTQLVKCKNFLNPSASLINDSNKNLSTVSSDSLEQSYSTVNPDDFSKFKQANIDMLNQVIDNEGSKGSLNYRTKIKFDIHGDNQSEIQIKSSSSQKIAQYLNGINVKGLPKSRIYNFNIPSQDILDFSLDWKTISISANKSSQGIIFDKSVSSNYRYSSNIEAFINGQIQQNGLFNFESKEKNLNGVSYYDLKLVSFINRGGPANVFYSMIMPGWGTKKVSNGYIGKGRMKLFLLSAALCIGSKIYSNQQYNSYKGGAGNNEQNYTNANLANKAFLISGGIAATVYLNDIIYVFRRGHKNSIQSQELNKKLKYAPIYLFDNRLMP